jgi:hypothetical protein
MHGVTWLSDPEEHDFPAAESYLGLLASPTEVNELVTALRSAPVEFHKAKDILRAAGLPLLPRDNPHVASDLDKIHKKTPLSPVMLVQGSLDGGRPAQIADGYHRVCASYYTDENTDIPCRVARVDGP